MTASSSVLACPDFVRSGPIVPIRIRSSGATHALRGLIDTGATRTVLGEAAAEPLRLARVGTGTVGSGSLPYASAPFPRMSFVSL